YLLLIFLLPATSPTVIYTLSLHDALPISKYLFVPLAEAVVFAMLASYFLSRTLVPTMVLYIMRGHEHKAAAPKTILGRFQRMMRSEEHTSELQSPYDLVCRLLLEKKKKQI